MNSFTGAIASYLLKKHGKDVRDVTIVFPGRRAGLFLLREMAAKSASATFAPRVTTLDSMASEMTGIKPGETLPLLYELYRSYISISGTPRSFDDFIFQGNTLLADFNECDNELVDIHKLYANITDLREIDDLYSDTVIYARDFILSFWQMFIGNRKLEIAAGFGQLWEKLPDLYEHFNAALMVRKTGYGGMIIRQAVQNSSLVTEYINKNKPDHIYFAGFNALTRAEKEFFSQFKQSGKASFLWDYDDYYLKDAEQEAGIFMRENLKRFPAPEDFQKDNPRLFSCFREDKNIKVIPVPQVTDQARYLEKLAGEGILGARTAIVLADEKMLIPVIHALPAETAANVTMGYEVRYTGSYALVDSILSLYKNSRKSKNGVFFRSSDATRVLMHYFFRNFSEVIRNIQKELLVNRTYVKDSEINVPGILNEIFAFNGSPAAFVPFVEGIVKNAFLEVKKLNEFASQKTELQALYEIYNQLKWLRITMEENQVGIENLATVTTLIKKSVSVIKLSFRGEPLIGLQIMGFLETRALDFENVIIISANEGVLPSTSHGNSFIPMTLRSGFKMRTPSYDEAIFAYNFYRLIQRAKNVWITWCTGQGITEKAEMSRYLLQMVHSGTHPLQICPVDNRPVVPSKNTVSVEKDENVMARLELYRKGEKRMSSSSLNTYIDCPLRFYFSYIAGMKEQDEPMDEDMDNRIIGSLFHKAAEFLYNSKFSAGEAINEKKLSSFSETDYNKAIAGAFADILKYSEINYSEYLSGTEWLYDEIIRRYLKALVKWDKQNCPYTYLGHEVDAEAGFGETEIKFYSRLDRLEEKNGVMVLSDYKASDLKGLKMIVETAFIQGARKRNYIFQMYFYHYILAQKFRKPVMTRLIAVNKLISADNSVIANDPLNKSEMIFFENELGKLISEIFSAEIPFTQTEDGKLCKYCNYKAICNRQDAEDF
jgi:CRISPR/Cas system-associated exonuclease Cas4 (RecB family)